MRAAAVSMRRKFDLRLCLASSAIWPAISTPVGPAPTTTKVEPRRAARGILLELGQLEGAEDPAAHLERVVDRLHARGVDGEVVATEVRLRRASGDDQAVVGELPSPVEQPAGDRAAREFDAVDLCERDVGVVLVAQDVPQRRCDAALGQDAGGDLLQQWLEEVVRLAVDEGHVDGRSAQRLRRPRGRRSRRRR
jgi:hypothetical protein